MIIELYGNPGCGKSFAVDYVLHNRDITSQGKMHSVFKEVVVRLIKKTIVLTPSALSIKRKIYIAIRGKNTKSLFIDRAVNEWIENLVMLNNVYKYRRRLLIDEGLIQRSVAMCVNFGWTIETLNAILGELTELNNVKCIYLDLPVEECLSSIKQRNRHKADMDNLDEDRLLEFLMSYDEKFRYITKEKGFITLKRNEIDKIKEIWNDQFCSSTLSSL